MWLQLLSELQAYVKQNHTTGVVWNSQKKSDSFEGQVWFSDIIATAASAGDEFTKLTNGPLKPFFVQDNWELNQLGRADNTLMLIILTFATLMNF